MKARGCPVTMFLNGATGNIIFHDFTHGGRAKSAEEMGRILADDVERVHGVRLAAGGRKAARAGDVVLRLVRDDPELKGPEAYHLRVRDHIDLTAGSYNALAFGTMTLLQVLRLLLPLEQD